ncbi:MAG: polysaccharide deacetylase family protein [Clostridia bacterium]|nr:polysaccharide deacetylase family protein [Clostridia bacterium]
MNHPHVFMRFPEGRAKAVTFSFDDGSDQDIWLCDLMKAHGLKATFNMNMGLLPPCENFDFSSLDVGVFPCKDTQHRLTLEQIKKVFCGSGMELATHGWTHSQLPLLSDDAIAYEILRDRKALEEIMNEPVRGHAYAQGDFDDRTVEALRHCGIVYARTARFTNNFNLPRDFMRWDPTCQYRDQNVMELCDKFLSFKPGAGIYFDETRAKLLYIFAHSYEFTIHNDFDQMERVAEKVAGHSDVWYCTNMEYYNYDKAFRNLDFNLERTRVHNPSAIPVWIYVNGKTVEVSPGETASV